MTANRANSIQLRAASGLRPTARSRPNGWRAAGFLPLLISFASIGCQADTAAVPEAVGTALAQDEPSRSSAKTQPRKLIRTAELDLTVEKTEAVAEQIQALTRRLGGYVATVNAYQRNERFYYQISIRVPVEQLDTVVSQIKAMAKEVQREGLQTEDVTDKYIDLQARISALSATEGELRALLEESRSRGHGAEDIMAIYGKLTEIRTQNEQLQGQLNVLQNQATYSTVNIQLRTTAAAIPLIDDRWRPTDTARSSLRTLVDGLQVFADIIIAFVIVVVPMALLAVVLPVWLIVRIWRLVRRRHTGA